MTRLHRIVGYPGVYLTLSTLLVIAAMILTAKEINRDIDAALDLPLQKTLGSYAATLEGGTINSRAMGAAILFGEENEDAKRLIQGKQPLAARIHSALDTLRSTYLAKTVILTDKSGKVIAYSHEDGIPGVGRDLSFRPYVQLALQGTPNVYPAVGIIDTSRGIFLSAPVRAKPDATSTPIGAVVVKIGADKLDLLLRSWTDGIALLLSPQGVVFAASRNDWLFRPLGARDASQLASIQRTRQFDKVFDPTPLPFAVNMPEARIEGVRHVMRSQALEWNDPEGDWQLALLERRTSWWARWSVLGFAGLSGLITSLALFWIYTVARNSLMLERMNAKLRRNDAQIEEAQRIAGLGSYALDISAERWESSNALDHLFGIDSSYEHTIDRWAALLHPDDRGMMLDYLRNEVIGQGKPFDREYRLIRRNDRAVRWMHGLGRLERNAEGRPVILHGTVQDITELKKTQEMLRLAKEQAEETSRVKSTFLSNMSHEIRTPMNTIIGMTQLALMNEHNPKQLDYLKKISLSGEHLLGIIDDILDFSKIEAGKLAMEHRVFELNQTWQTLKNLTIWKAEEKGIKLRFDIASDIPHHLSGDPLRLSQILLNYVGNAIKFTPQGEIVVRARQMGEKNSRITLRFEVQDTGIGISTEQKALLYQPFQQGDSSTSRTHGGTGLGLIISKRLAELMGGETGVESEPGKGSTFWFTAQLGIAPSMPSNGGESGAEIKLAAMAAIRGKRVLVAEDQPLNQIVAKEILEGAGAIVCTANNGKEALELLKHEPFDCVLMDVQMPVMDGLEAARQIRAEPALAKLPVLALTANAYDEDRQRCLAAGMNDFVSKPFKLDDFYVTVGKWI